MTAVSLIADPMPLFRGAVRTVLERDGFSVHEAASIEELVDVVRTERPAVALIDTDLPPAGALAALAHMPRPRLTKPILYGSGCSADFVFAALRAGAVGYLDKRLPASGLSAALKGVMRGEAPLSRELTANLVCEFQSLHEWDAVRELEKSLTPREHLVLKLIADGRQNKEIASLLSISPFTVKRHVHNLLEKLDVQSRHAAAAVYESAQNGVEQKGWRDSA